MNQLVITLALAQEEYEQLCFVLGQLTAMHLKNGDDIEAEETRKLFNSVTEHAKYEN